MKQLFNRIPLNLKLILSAIIPLLALLYYFYVINTEREIKIATTENFIGRLNSTVAVSDLSDQLQQERRLSLSYLVGRENESNLINQRKETDVAFSKLEELLQGGLNENYKEYTFINELSDWRLQVDDHKLSPREVLTNYQLLIERLQGNLTIKTDNPSIIAKSGHKLEASSAMARMVNLIAVMRLEIYLMLTDASASTSLNKFNESYNLYKSYEDELLANQNKEIVDDYNKLKNGSGLEKVLVYFDAVANNQRLDNTFDAEGWWRTSAASMDALKAMYQNLLLDAQKDATNTFNASVEEERALLIFLIILSLLIVIIVYYAIRSTTEQISALKYSAERMALGETGVQLPTFPKDALGALARSFVQIDRNNRKIALAAAEIGQNKFDTPFKARGKKDELGLAILKMRQSLKDFSYSKENEIWIQTGLSTINSVLIGKKNLDDTCNAVLASMVNYLDGDVGTLYLLNYSNTLELQCTHATIDETKIPKIIPVGQNRLGKAAESMEPVILN